MKAREILNESISKRLYSNQPLKFILTLLKKGVIAPRKGYISLSKDKNVALELEDRSFGGSYAGDTLVTFDSSLLSTKNKLIEFQYNDYKFWDNNPVVFQYATGMKWSNNLEEFFRINRARLRNIETVGDDPREYNNMKEVLLTIMADISFEREVAIQGNLVYVPGSILGVISPKILDKKTLSIFKEYGIKVIGQKNLAKEEDKYRQEYENRMSMKEIRILIRKNKLYVFRSPTEIQKTFPKGSKITSQKINGYIHDIYLSTVGKGASINGFWYLVVVDKKGNIISYGVPVEFVYQVDGKEV